MASWRPGVKGVYNRTNGWNIVEDRAIIPNIQLLDFLHALFAQGLGYSAINSHRSALSSIIQVPGLERIVEHNLVSRVYKRCF